MLGDLRVLDTGDELLLDTERVALQELFNTIRRFRIGFDVELHKRTLECGLLSLIGPGADRACGAEDLPARPSTSTQALSVGRRRRRAIRTDVGVDLLCAAEDTAALHDALTRAGAVPISEAIAETIRIERGVPATGSSSTSR